MAPLHPIQWNTRFCLSNPAIHTLSLGFPQTSRFDLIDGIMPASTPLSPQDEEIKVNLDKQKSLDPYSNFDGYCMKNDPSGINIPEILRFRMLWKCYDMKNFGLYRYNMFEEKNHWFPGIYPTNENLKKIDLSNCPKDIPVVELIKETHESFYKPKAEN